MHIDSISNLIPPIKRAGRMALKGQRKGIARDHKQDGSVVTETDRQVDEYLFRCIAARYPGANVLTEETARAFDPQRPCTFAVDPIDGSDAYSQGWVGWCTSVGLLDDSLKPVAGIVYAPALDLLFFADVGRRATLNGVELHPPARKPLSRRSNVFTYSGIHRQIDLRRLPAKVRSVGSGALHLCLSLTLPGVYGAIEGAGSHIWDVAGAHAVQRSVGWDLELLGGGALDYRAMAEGGPAGNVILAGAGGCVAGLRSALAPEEAR